MFYFQDIVTKEEKIMAAPAFVLISFRKNFWKIFKCYSEHQEF